MWFNSTNYLLLFLSLALCMGCERSETLGKVQGQVTLDGQPVAHGIVIFSNPAKGVHITAPLQSDGRYEIQMAQGFGLPLGEYQVAVNPPVASPPMPGAPPPPPVPPSNIPTRYMQPTSSGLTRTINEGENVFDIPMVSK